MEKTMTRPIPYTELRYRTSRDLKERASLRVAQETERRYDAGRGATARHVQYLREKKRRMYR